MRIWKIELENFQGIKSMSIEFGGKSASIYGDNGTGKTTVYNAVTWLLFDKSSTGAKGFTPKTRGKDGELHNLSHGVTAEIETDSGRRVILRKVLKESYKKKRGSAREEFTGHTIEYSIDGVPVKEKEFSASILDFCGGDEKRIRVLTMPDCFPEQLPWEERRKILLELVGGYSEEDVVAEDDELEPLLDILKMPGDTDRRYTVDEYRAVATARKSDINRQLQEIPARIDEAERMVAEAGKASLSEVEDAIKKADSEYTALVNQKSVIICAGGTDTERAIQDARMRLAVAKTKYNESEAERLGVITGNVASLRREHAKLVGESAELESELKMLRSELSRKTELRKELVERYKSASASTWDESNGVCPTCSRPFPAQKVSDMKAAFEEEKRKVLHSINEQGKAEASKEELERIMARISEIEKTIPEAKKKEDAALQSISELESSLDKRTPFEETDSYAEITKEIRELEEKLESDRATSAGSIEKLDEEMRTIRERRDSLEKQKASIAMSDAASNRIKELEKAEKDLSAVYEDLERGLYLCDLYTKTLVDMLTEKINERFKNVRFRLFQTQINGGVKEDCEVMIPSPSGSLVPYGTANNAARLNAGLEIIDTLSDFWGIRMPVILDNAEAVTHPYEMRTGQFIKLIVSERDKSLRVELE